MTAGPQRLSGSARAVDALPDQVRVPAMPGVFLDQMQVNPAHAHLELAIGKENLLFELVVSYRGPAQVEFSYIGGVVGFGGRRRRGIEIGVRM
jgi:hypothetical protein